VLGTRLCAGSPIPAFFAAVAVAKILKSLQKLPWECKLRCTAEIDLYLSFMTSSGPLRVLL
jgi:hypothetical protein